MHEDERYGQGAHRVDVVGILRYSADDRR